MWNDLPYTACVWHQTLDIDLREQSTVGRFPDLCLFQFSVAQALVRLRKQFIYNLFFPTWASDAGFNDNNNNDNNNLLSATVDWTCNS